MATIQQVRDAMHRMPFTPFTVRRVDGRSFVVDHPDFIAVSPDPRGKGVTIHQPGRVHQVDVLLVQSLDYPDPSSAEASPEENGAAS
jgi:hypothetical protein